MNYTFIKTSFDICDFKKENCKSQQEIKNFFQSHKIEMRVIMEQIDLKIYGKKPTKLTDQILFKFQLNIDS